MVNEYTCVDSFSGAGGLSLGLIEAGFDVILSFDKDDTCIETQKRNSHYLKHEAIIADIAEMRGGGLLSKTGLKTGELFLLAGGPPCQGFSIQRIGDDEDERNNLIMEYALLVIETQPQYFLMENVPGIMGKRGKSLLEESLDLMSNSGYYIHQSTLDAQDYGVPQRRKRVFIVGERVNGLEPNFCFPPPTVNPNERKTVRQIISNLPPPPEDGSDHPDIPNHRRDKLTELNKKRLQSLKPGQGRQHLPDELLADCHRIDSSVIGHRNVYGRMDWDDVAPTITAKFDSFTRGQFGHPEQIRSISLREGAALQTFPMDFVFLGGKIEIARQIGNAVPPQLAKVIGEQIIKCHEEKITQSKRLLI